eukprot:Pompholyxophrys_punicea_v1_NODE_835_length_1230_cov_3.129362.p1 type:complete len:134 gc:universal NODE_835_length_1230_cov_3.129362:673-1074(+)
MNCQTAYLGVGNERFRCPEILFQSSGQSSLNVQEIIYRSIMECDVALHKDLLLNIVLSGGNTLLPGFSSRLQKEILRKFDSSVSCVVVSLPERDYSAWTGAALLVSQASFQHSWISKQEYDEHGAGVVHRKCS